MIAKSSTIILTISAAITIVVVLVFIFTMTFNNQQSNEEASETATIDIRSSRSAAKLSPPTPIPIGLNPYIKEYALPREEIWPNGIAVDENQTVWFTGTKSGSLFRADLDKRGEIAFREFRIPDESKGMIMGWGVATDNQRDEIWFTDDKSGAIWVFDTSTEEFKKIELPTKSLDQFPVLPIQIAIDDKNGFVWFTELYGHRIGLIRPDLDYAVFEFPTPTNNSGPSGIFIGDEYVWFTEALSNKIARYGYNKSNSNLIPDVGLGDEINRTVKLTQTEEFTPSPSKPLNSPVGIFVDENEETVWVTEHGTSFIAAYNITNNTVFRFATSRYEPQIITLPYWIRSDSNGNVWFTEHAGNKIAMFNRTDFTLTEYEIPTRNPKSEYISNTMSLAVAPDDMVWFTEWSEDKIGVVDPTVDIPFTLTPSAKEIKISRGDSATVDLTIDIRGNVSNNNTIRFMASGTETPSGRLFNISSIFDPQSIMLPPNLEMKNTTNVKLKIKTDPSIKPGTYTITASATDGMVTRSGIIVVHIE
ncbi:MAG: virginiamycin B lyase family protein [Nitrososphaeraceae archaeon]